MEPDTLPTFNHTSMSVPIYKKQVFFIRILLLVLLAFGSLVSEKSFDGFLRCLLLGQFCDTSKIKSSYERLN